MILITGAAGKTGRAVVQALVRRGEPVRALVRRAEQVERLEGLGATKAMAGDLLDQKAVERAAAGARAMYHICPNMHPKEVEIGRLAIAAARAAGVERLVYHSVLHPHTEAMPHHWRKLRVEEMLVGSGLDFTVLRPAAYMQNVVASWSSVADLGVYPLPYAAQTRLTMVDLRDVAEVAARVLSETGHEGATYELCGPGYLSQTQVAETLARSLGREVRVVVVSLEAWAEGAREKGLDKERVGSLVEMFRYYERHGLPGNSRVLEWLLGHEPTGFRSFVRRAAREATGTR
ncbi:MAG: NmrA family NAD(P)-binding protein [bacterium]|nr:NmrA family NAD(P)-binding protein [bacterium]